MRKYIINNKKFNPIRMGDPGDFDYGCEPNATCHDCGCGVGELHHLNCDAQRCPACGLQFISCGCNIFVAENENKKKNFIDKTIYYRVLGDVDKLLEVQRIKKELNKDENEM